MLCLVATQHRDSCRMQQPPGVHTLGSWTAEPASKGTMEHKESAKKPPSEAAGGAAAAQTETLGASPSSAAATKTKNEETTESKGFCVPWAAASPLRPFNFFEVLRQQQLLQQEGSWDSSNISGSGVYIHLNVDLHYRQRGSLLQGQREMSLPFSLCPSLEGGALTEEQQRKQRGADEAAAAAAAAAADAEAAPGCLYRLEELYLCEPCGKVLSPLQVRRRSTGWFRV